MPAQTLYESLDEEAGGDIQPPHKSYSRLGLGLLAFVLVAGATAVGLDLYCPGGYICPFNNSDYVSTSSEKSVTVQLMVHRCASGGTDPGLECHTAYDYCTAFCSSAACRMPWCQGCGAACLIALDRCCQCGN